MPLLARPVQVLKPQTFQRYMGPQAHAAMPSLFEMEAGRSCDPVARGNTP